MAYSELIKNFDNIREYMQEFFVYGFKNRNDFDAKSARSYDNERRRIESWLGEYMSFRQNENGKNCFLSVDSKKIAHNPLYKAFKAKSFTAKDIMLNFYILDLLKNGERLTCKEIADRIYEDYQAGFEEPINIDASTIRKKLIEYVELGLLESEKEGREILYYLSADNISIDVMADAINFYAEAGQLGVVGSFLLDKLPDKEPLLKYKHHYILHALESEVFVDVLEAIQRHQTVIIETKTTRGREISHRVLPLKIYISTQTGRRYVLGWYFKAKRIVFYRLDNIRTITEPKEFPEYEKYIADGELMQRNLWGVSLGAKGFNNIKSLDHVELVIRADKEEAYVVKCLEREKRCGRVEKISEDRYRFIADVHDSGEMLPWLRTFMGRIESFTSTNKKVEKRFWDDIKLMSDMYGLGKEETNE